MLAYTRVPASEAGKSLKTKSTESADVGIPETDPVENRGSFISIFKISNTSSPPTIEDFSKIILNDDRSSPVSFSKTLARDIVSFDPVALIKETEKDIRICNMRPKIMLDFLQSRYEEFVRTKSPIYEYSRWPIESTIHDSMDKLASLNTIIELISSVVLTCDGVETETDGSIKITSIPELNDALTESYNILRNKFYFTMAESNRSKDNSIEHAILRDGFPYIKYRTPSATPFEEYNDFKFAFQYPHRVMSAGLFADTSEDGKTFSIFDKEKNVLLRLASSGELDQRLFVIFKQYPVVLSLLTLVQYLACVIVETSIMYRSEFLHIVDDILLRILYDKETDTKAYYPPTLLISCVRDCYEHGREGYAYGNNTCGSSSCESAISTEANPVNDSQNNVSLGSIDESYKSKWLKLQKMYIDMFKVKASQKLSKKNAKFFIDYYGRIPHLYEQYADRSPVYENTMNDDPTEILSKDAVEYVTQMSNDSTALFTELIGIAKRLASSTDINSKLNVVKAFCKQFPVDENDPYTLKSQFIRETAFRIATSILREVKIYGYTVDGIVENQKFPPANHIVTSIFVTNPHEKPFEQKVSDIFKSPESILVYAKPENLVRFENMYKETSMKVLNSFDHRSVSIAQQNLMNSTKSYASRIKKIDTMSQKEAMDPKEQKKLSKVIESTVIEAINMVVDQKQRCMQCIGVVHDMIARVTDLAMRCVVSMRQVEKQNSDRNVDDKDNYDSGNQYKQHVKTQAQLEANKLHAESPNGSQQENYKY